MGFKQFWVDPYQTGLDTTVAGVDGDTLTLASTIFFAFSGGQESDTGSIGGRPVLGAEKRGLDIVYTLAPGHGLRPGEPVRVEIDWPRRHALMRLHFAAEIVLELVCARLPGVAKIGAHIAADKARIDFEWPEPVTPLLAALAAQANAIVAADLAIGTGFSDEAAERRYWQIDGFARVPCGGTHVKRTGEIGAISLRRRNVGRGKERIEISVADPAPASD
ncbi:alanyl-tRNA editing protein [Jeongeupia chitinilytica]|uniref:Alanyl-tRNA editing protein n=1 Tax=Jeongeupia chitinilytica TaxID=1041641 RepID=A0ABQ3H0Z6_9NEIS|nr:alanyl-tRNA editing protein [Jeongeupia chitinilytica]GHD62383.1 alanyl-tRNA editing protein [Jeongeupia chitinilytica]